MPGHPFFSWLLSHSYSVCSCSSYLVVEMGRNSAYSSRNLLGSLLVLQHKFLALGFFFPNLPFKHHPSQTSNRPESNYELPNHVLSCAQSLSFPIPGESPAASCQSLQALLMFQSFLSAHPHRTHIFLDVIQGQNTRGLSKARWSIKGRNKVRGSKVCSKRLQKSCREGCVAALSHVTASSMDLYIWSA